MRLVALLILASLSLAWPSSAGLAQADAAAPDPARLMREIRSGLTDRTASNETLSDKILKLAEAPSSRVVRFLVQQVLGTLDQVEQRHDIDREPLIEAATRALWRIQDTDESLTSQVANWFEQLMFRDRLMAGEGSHKIVELHLAHRADKVDADFYRQGLWVEYWSIRVIVSHHLANHGTEVLDDAGRNEVLENRWDIDYRVRSATAFVIERMILDAPPGNSAERVAAYRALVEILDREESGLRYRVTEMLHGRTGMPYPDEASLWRSWVNSFEAGEVEENPGGRVQSDMNLNRYFGVQIPRKMVFVIDTSMSMGTELRDRDAIRKRLEEQGEGREFDWENIKTRLDLARAELIHVIEALEEPDPAWRRRNIHPRNGRMPGEAAVGDAVESFTVIAYNSRVRHWRETVVPATRRNKDAAIEWIKGLRARDLTNFYDAIDTALHMANGTRFPDSAEPAEPKSDRRKGASGARKHPPEEFGGRMGEEESIEAVIFLTDAYATTGKYWTNAHHTFSAIDTEERGYITYEQFEAQFDTDYMEEKMLRDLFDRLDTDDNGRVTRNAFEENLRYYHRLQMENLVREITIRNFLDRVRLHTIGIGNHDRWTLQRLARYNDGIYVDLGE